MNNFFKKCMLMLVMVVVIMGNFTGCSMFEIDNVSFYNAVVATVGDETITRYDLLYAYNQYGYDYYVSSYGYTVEEALEATLDVEIDRVLLLEYAEANFELTNAEINEMWDDIYSYFDSAFASYEQTAADKLGVSVTPEDDDSVTDTTDENAFVEYERRAEVIYDETTGKYVISYIVEDDVNEDLEANGYENYNCYITNDDLYEMAKELYADDLIESKQYLLDENGDAYSEEIEDVIAAEFKRVYESQYEYVMILKIEEYYLANKYYLPSDIIQTYQNLVTESYMTYAFDTDAYDSIMLSSPESVYYHPNDDYYYVSHILIGFSDEQTEMLASYDARLVADSTFQAEYDALVEALYASILTEDGLSPTEVLNSLTYDLSTAYTTSAKATVFNDYIYMYNTDPGMFNADTPYVDSVDKTQMVTEFNEAGAELYEAGTVGAISGLVRTEYGYHIIYYAGTVKSTTIDYNAINNININDLSNIVVNEFTGKTLFDAMFDYVYPDDDDSTGYSTYETNLLNLKKETVTITIYSSVLSSTTSL